MKRAAMPSTHKQRMKAITKADVVEGMLRYPLNLTPFQHKLLTGYYLNGRSKASLAREVRHTWVYVDLMLELSLIHIGVLTVRWANPKYKARLQGASVYNKENYKVENGHE